MAYIIEQYSKSRRAHIICQSQLERGQKLFKRFHNYSANETITKPFRRKIPKILVKLGSLKGIIYSSDKWQLGHPQTYIHFMETPPLLVCNPKGTQLYIVGGNYRITPKGIEG